MNAPLSVFGPTTDRTLKKNRAFKLRLLLKITLAFQLCVSAASSKPEEIENSDISASTEILLQTSRFDSGRISESGAPSKTAKAFAKVARHPESHNIFLKMFREAEFDAGKLYALLGLYQTSRKDFESLSSELDGTREVNVRWYGAEHPVELEELIGKIEDGSLLEGVADFGVE
jgi:hypothetical protein